MYQIRPDQSLSRVRLFATPWIPACQASLSMGFSRKENWSGLPLLLQCAIVFVYYYLIFSLLWGRMIIILIYSSVGKESACSAGDPGLIPGSGRSPGEGIGYPLQYSWAFLVAQLVKNPPAMWETWVGKIPWRRERWLTPVLWPGEFHKLYSPWSCKELDTTEWLSLHCHSTEGKFKFWEAVYFAFQNLVLLTWDWSLK